MTADQRLWFERFDSLTRPSYSRWVQPPGGRIHVGRFRVYALAMRFHLWCWRCGVRL